MAKNQALMLFAVALTLLFSVGTSAQTTEPRLLTTEQGHDDCTDVSIKYVDDPSLTRQERLEEMDQALKKSLSMFERCQRKQLSDTAASSATSAAAGTAPTGGSPSSASLQSSASGNLAGDEAPATAATASSAAQPVASAAAGGVSGNESATAPAPVLASIPADNDQDDAANPSNQLGNGKVPEDIPSADNDSVLEAQIRRAAMAETNPEIRAKLWDEYRKYKGLPEVEN